MWFDVCLQTIPESILLASRVFFLETQRLCEVLENPFRGDRDSMGIELKSSFSQRLAIDGGPPARQAPFPPHKRHGRLDLQYLKEVVDSDVMFFFAGTKVFEFQKHFAQMYGRKHCIACSSGTAAVHMAIAALQLPPGSEVIVPPITDMGTLTGVLYQGLIPVFADVDPKTLNMDPVCVSRCITNRTRAILVVHHGGLAAHMDSLLDIAQQAGIPVVEDCAQALGCKYKGRLAGTMGVIAAFSLNHFKHIDCGSGGMVLTDDDGMRYFASLFLDKCYQREEGLRNPFFLAPNYQMTEMQGAVALAQIQRLQEIVVGRNRLASQLTELLRTIPGITPQFVPEGCYHSYFLYLFSLDLDRLRCSPQEFSAALEAEGVPNQARQITGGRPVYLYDLFQKHSAFPGTHYPFDRFYAKGICPVAEDAFDRWITMNVYENYTDQNIEEIALAIGKVARFFGSGKLAKLSQARISTLETESRDMQ
jgi:perosamine synthetase